MNLDFENLSYLEAISKGVSNLKTLVTHGFAEEDDSSILLLYGSMSDESHFLQFVLGDEVTDKYYDFDIGIIENAPSLTFVEEVGTRLSELLNIELVKF